MKIYIIACIAYIPNQKWALEPMVSAASSVEEAERLAKKSLALTFDGEDYEFQVQARELSWEHFDELNFIRPQIENTDEI